MHMNIDIDVWFDDNGHLMAREVNVHLAEIRTSPGLCEALVACPVDVV